MKETKKILIFRCSKCNKIRGCTEIGEGSILRFCLVGSENQCLLWRTDDCLRTQAFKKNSRVEVIKAKFNCCFKSEYPSFRKKFKS